MERPTVHVAMIGQVWDRRIEYCVIRRAVDQMVLVFDSNVAVEAHNFVAHLQDMAIEVTPIPIGEHSFSAILSAVLASLNNTPGDECSVEFNITCASKIMTIVASVAAAIVHGTIVYSEEVNSVDMAEVWPTELTTLTRKKMEVLRCLSMHDNPVHQRTLAKELDIPQSGISRHVRDLELAGYLSRETVSRKKVICISDLGSAVMHSKHLRKRRIWTKRSKAKDDSLQIRGLLQKHGVPSVAS